MLTKESGEFALTGIPRKSHHTGRFTFLGLYGGAGRDMGSGVVSQGVDADENRMDYFNYFDFVYFASCIGTNYTFYY